MPGSQRRSTQQPHPHIGFQYDSKVAAWADIADSLTKPATIDASAGTANRRVIPISDEDAAMEFTFGGTDAEDEEMGIYIGYIEQLMDYDGTLDTVQFTVTPIWRGMGILGAKTGVASGMIADTDFRCDTLAVDTTSAWYSDHRLITPADDSKASLTIKMCGYKDIVVILDLDELNPVASANFCYRSVNW